MSESSTYPPVTRGLVEARRALAPEIEDAFRAFSQKVFADGALPAKTKQLIAVAVAQSAPILVLDEPTAHLDIRHQVDVMELLADLNRRDGTTVIAVLHDLALAAHFFPRVVVMSEGRIVADGPPAQTLGAERIRSVFGVDPALVRLPVGAA